MASLALWQLAATAGRSSAEASHPEARLAPVTEDASTLRGRPLLVHMQAFVILLRDSAINVLRWAPVTSTTSVFHFASL